MHSPDMEAGRFDPRGDRNNQATRAHQGRKIWRTGADDQRMATIDSDHHMAEEAPEELAQMLNTFLDE
jgi:hypothetical protein